MPLLPTSTGIVFSQTATEHEEERIPTNELPSHDPFVIFWHNFLATLLAGNSPAITLLWKTLMTIYKGSRSFVNSASDAAQFRVLFFNNPPDVVVTDFQDRDVYGLHRRSKRLWSYIYISKYWIERWVAAAAGSAKQGYEALLKASLVHEIAHWAQTLVLFNLLLAQII
jgi:hypothetical protein